MENNFYRDHFEQLLKDSSDNFRLYPSRRIWHGIYNNLHPGKKWPSFAVLILLMFTISYLGITNPTVTTPQLADNSILRHEIALNETTGFSASILKRHTTSLSVSKTGSKSFHLIKFLPAQINTTSHNVILGDNDIAKNILSTTTSDIVAVTNKENVITGEGVGKLAKSENVSDPSNAVSAVLPSNDLAKTDKEWIEDYALHNINPRSKERQKWAFQIYATPSVGYRILQKSDDLPETNNRNMLASATEDDYYINHSNALNLEAGGNLLYAISDRFRVKAGVQFNYTNYYVSALDLNHPVSSNLLITDINNGLTELLPKASTLSNEQTESNNNYNNNTYQFSVPLGADVKIVGNNVIKWFAGATIQPTYISGGNAFLLSSDLKNYINDASFMRKFNMNGGLETFVSYKLKTGLVLNAGPQVRYQFLSTYNDQYNYKEKLFNFGIKLGITSKF